MFTGIITDIGTVEKIIRSGNECRMRVRSSYDAQSIAIGASIAHDGCCLTVVDKESISDGAWHEVDISPHTLQYTTLGRWEEGQRVNLERALRAGDELGGHIVSGHVDGLATIQDITHEGESVHYTMHISDAFAPFIAGKGSVTLDGVSLTVTWAEQNTFGLTLIPHTLHVTTWGSRKVGDALNLELDMLARYMKRMMDYRSSPETAC